MKDCPNADRLFAIGEAVGWEIETVIDHIAGCDRCRVELTSLGSVRDTLGEGIPTRAGFEGDVMAAIAEAHPGPARAAPRQPALSWLVQTGVTALLAGITAIFAVPAGASPMGQVSLGSAILTGLTACLGAAAWSWRTRARTRPA